MRRVRHHDVQRGAHAGAYIMQHNVHAPSQNFSHSIQDFVLCTHSLLVACQLLQLLIETAKRG